MDSGQTSFELLAHFDRPKTVDRTDVDWMTGVESAAADGAPAALRATVGRPQPPLPSRGVGWVLQWAAALAVLAFTASILTEFAYLAAAEHALALAARAGALEATLPGATYQSVAASVERRLTNYPLLTSRLRLSLQQNGLAVGPQFRLTDGDRLYIALSAPTSAVVPDWLRTMMVWREASQIRVHAERQMPGRKLQPVRRRSHDLAD